MTDTSRAHDVKMRIANIFSRYTDLKEASIPTLTNQHSYKVSQFHKMLKNMYGKSLAKLQVLTRVHSLSLSLT
jgi:uncharacterized protein (DUF1810 family)